MAKPLKILVCGDVEGRFKQLFNRVATVNKKAGPFDMLLCVGEFFGDSAEDWAPYAMGQAKVPIETLVLGPNVDKHKSNFNDPEGCELAENITYLGTKGLYTGSSGLQVAYLSGVEGPVGDETHFSSQEAAELQMPFVSDPKFKGVDILLASPWPKGVEKYGSSVEGVDSSETGSTILSQLAIALRPRYHFAAMEGVHYERQPYRNHRVLAEKDKHVTRFIAMAKVGNPQKEKYLYAFNIIPMKHMDPVELTKQPADNTECPFKHDDTVIQKKQEEAAQFFFNMNAGQQNQQRTGKRPQGQKGGPPEKRKQPQATGPCWFCLGSPEVEKHLVVSVGTHTYLALAKGGLTPEHVLICPIGHHQSLIVLPDDVLEEINRFKSALKKCFRSHGKAAVFFERNYKTQHLQIQVVPVPTDVICEVKEAFEECAKEQSFELHEIPKHSDIKQIVPAGAPYFYAELPGGEKMLYRISKGFPLQFGREVLAQPHVLNMVERIDWRNCKTCKEEESSQTADFRTMFASLDFNL